jgi:branched-chain amino acid aminotransferase
VDPLIFHNDRVVGLNEARLSAGQTGLLTGWGVFTTLRLYRGQPFAFERHWARLSRDAERLSVPLARQEPEVREAVVKLARANRRRGGMARVAFIRNKGGLWEDQQKRPPSDLLVFTRELVAWPPRHRLTIQPLAIFARGELAGAKMLSWVAHALTLEQAHAAGFDEVLLLNEKGQIAECASANIFLVRGKSVLTPPLSSGCLPGVTRAILLEIAPQAGIELAEQNVTLDDLSSVDEVFISSTTREVAPVELISPRWSYQAPGRVTRILDQAFHAYVAAHLPDPGAGKAEESAETTPSDKTRTWRGR